MMENFYHEGTTIVNAMRDLRVGIFEHLNIISWSDVDERIKFIERILKGATLKKFRAVLLYCKGNIVLEAGENWNLGKPNEVSMENFWTFEKADVLDTNGQEISTEDHCNNIERNLWFQIGKSIWKNHQSLLN